jgi:hypothetical protein
MKPNAWPRTCVTHWARPAAPARRTATPDSRAPLLKGEAVPGLASPLLERLHLSCSLRSSRTLPQQPRDDTRAACNLLHHPVRL